MSLPRFLQLVIVAPLLAATAARAAEEAPGWLREASTRSIPTYDAKVPGVLLFRERRTTVEPDGRLVTSTREAIKVLSREGRADALASEVYTANNSKLRDMKAWMLAPSGELLNLGKDAAFDRGMAGNDVYTEIRVRGIDGRAKADPGSVFGFEIVSEDHALFSQLDWSFQTHLPALVSRYILTLPPGWTAQSLTYNSAAIKPAVDGSTYTWEARDLPFIETEPAGPHLTALLPRVAISYSPPAGSGAGTLPAFSSWKDVSRWATGISEAQAQPDDAIALKAKALTAKATTDMERIQALGWFVQGIRYVSIQTGLGRGGGYRPKPAADVLGKEYGDCKDKATLMRALLKAVGIESYLVTIYANDRSYVHEEWPSPQQFNHAIVAIRVPAGVTAGAVIEHPALGRLLLFDATSGSTPAGDLPVSEQGSLALVAAGDRGDLIRAPVTSPSFNVLEREIDAEIDEAGSLTARLAETAHGQSAALDRSVFNSRAPAEYRKAIESWISASASGAEILKVEPSDAFLQGRFALRTEFKVPHYAQLRANRLMISNPA